MPLVLRAPGVKPGTVIDQQVRLMDLGPTLLELAGLASWKDVEGVSLKPALEGGSIPFLSALAESAPYRPQFPEDDLVYLKGNQGKWRMVRTERWKLIRIPHPEGPRYELYDLASDPGETRNLIAELPGQAGQLGPILDAWIASDPGRDRDSGGEDEKAIEGLDPAAREQLRTLGYIH